MFVLQECIGKHGAHGRKIMLSIVLLALPQVTTTRHLNVVYMIKSLILLDKLLSLIFHNYLGHVVFSR